MTVVGERYEVELHCYRCNRTTVHMVTTGASGLSRVTCIPCGRAEAVHTLQFMEQYVNSVMRRLMAKPFDIATEFARSPRDFVVKMPGRVLSKPFRVAAELRTTLDIIRLRPHDPMPRPTIPAPTAVGELPPVERRCKVLLSAPVMWAHSPEEILEVAHDLGYDGVELWAYQLLRDRSDLARLGVRARDLGLMLTLHALSWDLNLTSNVDSIRTASLDALHRSVDLAAELGAHLLVMHPGHTTVPYDAGYAYWSPLVRAVGEVADHAARVGIAVGIEHMEPRQTEYVVTAHDVNRLITEVDRPNVGTVLDVSHIPWGEDEAAFIAQLERIIHVHLSDTDQTRLHLPLGQGGRDLVRVLTALHRFQGAVAIEGFSISAGTELARWNKALFEILWRASVEPVMQAHGHSEGGGG